MRIKSMIIDILYEIAVAYALAVLVLVILAFTVGNLSMEYTSVFALGNKGLTLIALVQQYIICSVFVLIRRILFSYRRLEAFRYSHKVIMLYVIILVVSIPLIKVFGWIKKDFLLGWLAYFICYTICFFISTVINIMKLRAENIKLNENLQQFIECEEERKYD